MNVLDNYMVDLRLSLLDKTRIQAQARSTPQKSRERRP